MALAPWVWLVLRHDRCERRVDSLHLFFFDDLPAIFGQRLLAHIRCVRCLFLGHVDELLLVELKYG